METSNITLRRLKTFLKFLENKFALKNHTHLSDSELSETSMNPVQNKVITKALQEKAGTNDITTLNRTVTELQENKADKTEVPKLVKVDGTTITMDDATKIIKLAQALQTKINSIDDKLPKSSVVNNLITTEEGFALDARQGKVLNDKISAINISNRALLVRSGSTVTLSMKNSSFTSALVSVGVFTTVHDGSTTSLYYISFIQFGAYPQIIPLHEGSNITKTVKYNNDNIGLNSITFSSVYGNISTNILYLSY